MSEEETVQPQENIIEQHADNAINEHEQPLEEIESSPEIQKQVPLSALQKERRKRQELELELKWERERISKEKPSQPPEEDNSKYESATREDLSRAQLEIVRIVDEKRWIKDNPEKYELVNEHLPKFLKERPNWATSISNATNRYEEAYDLMNAFTPKQQQKIKTAPVQKKEAPGSPGSIPKAAALDQAVDVMKMTDAEFSQWRRSQKSR